MYVGAKATFRLAFLFSNHGKLCVFFRHVVVFFGGCRFGLFFFFRSRIFNGFFPFLWKL